MVDEKNQHEDDGVDLINRLFEEDAPVEEPRVPAKPATPRKRTPRKPAGEGETTVKPAAPRKPRTKKVVVVEDAVTTTSVDGVPAAVEENVTVAEVEVPAEATADEVVEAIVRPAPGQSEYDYGFEDYVDAINDEQPDKLSEAVGDAARMRPDQVIVGEVRDASAHDFAAAAGGNSGGYVPPSNPAGNGAESEGEPVTPTLASVFTGKTKAPWLLTATIANALAVLSLVLWFIPGSLAVLVGLVAASVAWRKKEKPSGWVKGNFWFSLVSTAFSAVAVLITLVFVFVMVIFAWVAAAASHYDVSPYMY